MVTSPSDATIIADDKWFHKIYIKWNYNISDTDNIAWFTLLWENPSRTSINIAELSLTDNCEIQEAYVTWNLDNNIILRNCMVQNINYFNWVLYNTLIQPWTVLLWNNATAYFLGCMSWVPWQSTPIIDMWGTWQALAMRNYSG